MRSRYLALILALSMPLCGQVLDFSGTPALGSVVTFEMTGVPGAPLSLAVSENPGPVVLPFGTLQIGIPFYALIQSGSMNPFAPVIGPNGSALFSAGVPNSPALIGQAYYFQGGFVDSTAPAGIVLTNGTSFTVLDPTTAPTIASVSPMQGPHTGSQLITISGTNFAAGNTTAMLGGVALAGLTVVNPQTMTGYTPAGTPNSSADLVIMTPTGTATQSSAYFYDAVPPSLSFISPGHCPIGGGTLITVFGFGLGPETDIYLGGMLLHPLQQTNGSVVAISPPINQLGHVDLTAVSPHGIHNLSNAFRYTIPLETGNGSDGPLTPLTNVTLDTTSSYGLFNFTNIYVPSGVTVTFVGAFIARVRCTGDVLIEGTIDLGGQPGTSPGGGVGGPGGGMGGDAGTAPGAATSVGLAGQGPGGGPAGLQGGAASYGTVGFGGLTTIPPTYGSLDLVPLVAGSGGGGSEFAGTGFPGAGGGGGGGALEIAARESVIITGTILARGGNGGTVGVPGGPSPLRFGGPGSGGAIRIVSQNTIALGPNSSVAGGTVTDPTCPGCVIAAGGNGRWSIVNWLGVTNSGTIAVIPGGYY